MINLRKKTTIEEINSASMSDIAFLLLVFFMVASVFYLKEGIMSKLPKKEAEPQVVEKENIYRLLVQGEKITLKHARSGKLYFKNIASFQKKLQQMKFDDIGEKYVLIDSAQPTRVHHMVTVLGAVRDRGFLKVSMQK